MSQHRAIESQKGSQLGSMHLRRAPTGASVSLVRWFEALLHLFDQLIDAEARWPPRPLKIISQDSSRAVNWMLVLVRADAGLCRRESGSCQRVLTLGVSAASSTTRKPDSIHACSLTGPATRGCGTIEMDRGPMTSPGGGGQNARGDRGTGRWGIAASRIMRLTSQTDVLGWEFLPIKRSCRLDRGPMPAAAAWLPHFVKLPRPRSAESRML